MIGKKTISCEVRFSCKRHLFKNAGQRRKVSLQRSQPSLLDKFTGFGSGCSFFLDLRYKKNKDENLFIYFYLKLKCTKVSASMNTVSRFFVLLPLKAVTTGKNLLNISVQFCCLNSKTCELLFSKVTNEILTFEEIDEHQELSKRSFFEFWRKKLISNQSIVQG